MGQQGRKEAQGRNVTLTAMGDDMIVNIYLFFPLGKDLTSPSKSDKVTSLGQWNGWIDRCHFQEEALRAHLSPSPMKWVLERGCAINLDLGAEAMKSGASSWWWVWTVRLDSPSVSVSHRHCGLLVTAAYLAYPDWQATPQFFLSGSVRGR